MTIGFCTQLSIMSKFIGAFVNPITYEMTNYTVGVNCA